MRRLTREEAGAHQILDRRLSSDRSRPLVVAFSGGGDSLALLLMADAWARQAGRELLIVTIDHRLQAASAEWARACERVAERLGRPFRTLAWEGSKPTRGLPAAARRARHDLLAQAACEAGAHIIILGHTADDILEARAMRAAGSTTPEPREWAPSPAWPIGRGLFLLRPMLGQRRANLRAWLNARGEAWIDDPANADPRFARVRARLLTGEHTAPVARVEPPALSIAEAIAENAGVLTLARERLREAPPHEAQRLIAMACVCAGGGARATAGLRVARAAEALRGGDAIVATLAGARLEADRALVRIFREVGEAARGGLARTPLSVGETIVWDGRFEITAARSGLEVRHLAGLTTHLVKDERHRLSELPSAARGGLPAVVDASGAVTCPSLGGDPSAEVRSLVGERLRAAAGLVTREPA